ncbi:MAG: class I SAM-dependent methyltransferase [Elusimicrobia bacterium]|nr:class I SAM-dependent methyltransferase [Elusimicrobiota bacterium]
MAKGPLVLPTRQGYDLWAEVYDTDGNPLTAMEEPVVDRLLGPVRGLRVADVGCGTGRHALRLARRGARVTGLDFSQGMLAKARAKPGAAGVRFVRHDLARPLPLRSGSCDRVVCSLVLEHIKDLGRLFRELKRVCRPGGLIVVSAMHPALWLKGQSARFFDPESGRDVRPRSHRQCLSDYVMAAAAAGLSLAHMSEHAPDRALARRFPRAAKHLGWPLLVVMALRKD